MGLKTTVSTHGTQTGSFDGYVHDAAYAHALVTAIAEIESLGPYDVRTKYNGEEMIQSIRGIACRLMHEWGLEERARS